MRHSLRPAIAGLFVIGLLLAACGGGGTAQPDQGGGDAQDGASDAGGNGTDSNGGADTSGFDLCDAATVEEVAEITGADVVDSTSASSSGVLSCNYNAAENMPVAGTTLMTTEIAGVANAQAIFDGYREATDAEEVSGVGDAAVMTGSDDFPILAVMVDGQMYSLSVLADNLDGPGKREATIELARLTVDRLP